MRAPPVGTEGGGDPELAPLSFLPTPEGCLSSNPSCASVHTHIRGRTWVLGRLLGIQLGRMFRLLGRLGPLPNPQVCAFLSQVGSQRVPSHRLGR